MARPKSNGSPNISTATIGFEAKLWLTADKLRNNMDAAEPSGARQPARQGSPKGQRGGAEQYKHVVLGLIFLKYISDTFEEHRAKLLAGKGVLPKCCARPGLDKQRLGELIDLIAYVLVGPQEVASGKWVRWN